MNDASPAFAPFPVIGEPAAWFTAPVLDGRNNWAFHSIGGRVCLMLFYGTMANAASQAAMAAIGRDRALFDDMNALFFGISVDPQDAENGRIAQHLPGIRHFLDYDRGVSRKFGAASTEEGDGVHYKPHFLLLDRTLRIAARYPIDQAEQAIAATRALIARHSQDWAPVLEVPALLEPQLCADLIAHYEANGGEPSGFMREVDGKTKLVVDPGFKRREDCTITDATLHRALVQRIERRLVPMVQRAFQYKATRVERYIVARYDADSQGFFSPHRDNTTKGTAHRRFAVTVNLNEDYDGGNLRFPEFGGRTYRAPPGGAIVFSCSLLHEATPVTRGTRYAFLPFLYDEAGAALREANNVHLDEAVGQYRAGEIRP